MTDSLLCGICDGDGGYNEGSPQDLYLSALEAFFETYATTDFQCSDHECYTDWGPLDGAAVLVRSARDAMPGRQ